MKYKLPVVVFIFLITDLAVQVEPLISSSLLFNDGRATIRTLRFGTDPLATDGIDLIFGETLVPPFPPAGILEAQFFLPTTGFNGEEASYWDFRQGSNPMTGIREHRIKYQKGLGDSVTISWSFPDAIQANITDMFNGTILNIQLTGTGSYVITSPDALSTLKMFVQYTNATKVDDDIKTQGFELFQNYPNPFNPFTDIKYSLPERGYILLRIFDLAGNEVSTLINEEKPAGTYEYQFNAANLSSGIYFCRLIAGEFTQTKKVGPYKIR